jgi:integrase
MSDLATIRSILPQLGQMEACVARAQYQRPSVLKRGEQWAIRPRVPKLDPVTGKYKRVQTWIILGRISEMKKTQASLEADRIMTTINDGKFVATAQLAFSIVVEKYCNARLKTLGDRTQLTQLSQIKTHILPHFGAMRVADIDAAGIEAWINSRDLASTTKNSLMGVMASIFAAMIDWGYWSNANPCKRVKIGRVEAVREKRLLTTEELQRFLSHIHESTVCTAECARLVAMTAVVSGLRVSEVLGLQWQDVDFEQQRITVQRRGGRGSIGPTKSKTSKRVIAVEGLAELLKALLPAEAKLDGWVFSRAGAALDDRYLQKTVFRPAAERAGIYQDGFGMHWLRALNVTWRQHAGATPLEAMKAAGHSSTNMTAHYTLVDRDREKAQVGAIMGRITVQ